MTASVHDVTSNSLAAEGAMTIQEAVDFLRISRTEVYRLMQSNGLAFSKLGKRRLILRRSAILLLERGVPSQQRCETATDIAGVTALLGAS